ncbi:MAG: hypothetical protein VYA51_02110 [Planctomycetota bacterium]|nr:hypothetical protein [Planctomycetota bacterium]
MHDHVVVVLYWRLGCAHSRAALSELALASVKERGRPVAFVAVHVPIDADEDDDGRVRRQLAQLPAPIVAAVAREPGDVERLPMMVLVDASGEVQARAPGVPRRGRLRAAVDALVQQAHDSGRAAQVPFVPHELRGRGGLRPVALAHDGEYLWVASAAQRKVLAVDAAGEITRSYGSGAWGRQDGGPDSCSFALPGALALHDGFVAVADAQTHTLRAIDVANDDVVTWVGDGQFGADEVGGGYGQDQPLSSPAGMVSHDGGLYVCQAGTDQIWQVDPMTGAAMAWLGANYGGEGFRQPVALAQADDQLWLAEAGAGALTCVDLAHVEVRERLPGLQRPSAVAVAGGRVFVADAAAGEVWERVDGALRRRFGREHGLVEPACLASDGGRLYVGDVGADAVLVVDLLSADAPTLARLELAGLQAPARLRSGPRAEVARPCHVAEFSDVVLRVPVSDASDGDSVVVDVQDEADPVLAAARDTVVQAEGGVIEVILPVQEGLVGALRIRLQHGGRSRHFVLPVSVSAAGAMEVELVLDGEGQ